VEIYSFIALENKISDEEAEEVDLILFVKKFMEDSGAMSFFKSAVK